MNGLLLLLKSELNTTCGILLVCVTFAKAREIAAWKKHLRREWKNVEVVSVNTPDSNSDSLAIGKEFNAEIVLNIGDLKAEELGVEILFATEKKGKLHIQERYEFTPVECVDGRARYVAAITPDHSGTYQVSLDVDKVQWATTVMGQNLPWTNVCDIRGAAPEYVTLYNLLYQTEDGNIGIAVPAAFVINDGELVDGEIVDEASFRKLLEKLLK